MADWFYFQGGNQQGPVSDDQMRAMVASGQLQPQDSVWRQGMANWAPISSVPELMSGGGAPAAAPMGGEPMGGYAAPDAGYDRGPDYGYQQRPAATGGVQMITPWSIILVAGGGLWFINTFLPWASAPILGTYLGFSFGVGVFAFIISLFVLGAVITSFFVPILAEWRWTGAFFFALMALIILIMGMVLAFRDFGGAKSVGPWINLPASLAVLAGGVLEGIFGLLGFLARMKSRGQR